MTELLTGKIMGTVAVVMAILMVAFGVYHFFYMEMLEGKIKEQADTIGTLTIQNGVLKGNVASLTSAITAQNNYLEELKKAQKDTMELALQKIDAANQEAKTMKAKYEKLLNAPRPEGPMEQALTLKVDSYLRERVADAKG